MTDTRAPVTELISDIRSRLPLVAIGHPRLAADIERALTFVEDGRVPAGFRLAEHGVIRTEAGEALASFLGVPNHAAIVAIEAEALAAAVERVRALDDSAHCHRCDGNYDDSQKSGLVNRAAVLVILENGR